MSASPNQTERGASRRAVLAHRLALAVLSVLRPRRRASTPIGRHRIAILLMSAGTMSGAVRSFFSVAEHLALSHENDVEIVAVLRRRRQYFFAPPEGVRITTVEDRVHRRSGRRITKAARRRLARWRGRLIHPADKAAWRTTAWTDLKLVRAFRRLDADVIIASRFSLAIIASRFARPGVVIIVDEQMNLQRKGPLKLQVVRDTYSTLDAVVVLTEADRDAYAAMLRGRTRVVCIPNPVPAIEGPRSAGSHPVILGAGRLTWQKGFDRLVEAFATVAENEPRWTLRICGDGPAMTKLRELAVRLGIEDRVQLPGRIADLASEMEQASIFALSSRFEGFPMVLLEAMSKGLPVVAFDCPTGPADILGHGQQTGHLVPNGDTKAFAAALLDLMGDEATRRRLGSAATQRAEAFSIDRVGAMWTDLLAELVAARRRPPRAGAGA
jgi:glycosyltransferase involved in cell wall biosynthesis